MYYFYHVKSIFAIYSIAFVSTILQSFRLKKRNK